MIQDVPDSDTFSLPEHERESLSHEHSAERIANHFVPIQEFPPIKQQLLPERARRNLESYSDTPTVSEYEVHLKMKYAKKPRSGVPQDFPKQITQEFLPELAASVSKIIDSILVSGKWHSQWKMEQVIPIPKIQSPETEDDLRPISLTPFLSNSSLSPVRLGADFVLPLSQEQQEEQQEEQEPPPKISAVTGRILMRL